MGNLQLSKAELRNNKIPRDEFFDMPRTNIYIVLDSLKCAHNVGTILRLADALMIKKMFICGNTIIPPNKKIRSSSRGSEKWVPWEYRENVVDVINELKKDNVTIISAEIADNSIDYKNLKTNLPLCLVFGREFDGVNPDVLKMSDYIVHLPIIGMANSINVSTTASVLMYHFWKQ